MAFLFSITPSPSCSLPQCTFQGCHKASWVWGMGTAVCPHIKGRGKKARRATNEEQTPALLTQRQASMKICPPILRITPLLQGRCCFIFCSCHLPAPSLVQGELLKQLLLDTLFWMQIIGILQEELSLGELSCQTCSS